jgi:hypothetical protein
MTAHPETAADELAARLRANPPTFVTRAPGAQSANGAEPGYSDPRAEIDEEAFWTSREVLDHIRTFARARLCSPWAVLGAVMARTIAATPFSVCLPPIIGGRASLNLAVGLVGRSGGGKGAAEAAARDSFSLGERALSFKTHKLGSGQGIAHGYVRWGQVEGADGDKKQGLVQHTEACLFTMHEVDHLVGLSGQRGSTLLPELRSALMGEALGHLYADQAKRVEVEPHTYRLAMTIGIQPARAGVLLDDSDGGTPQRLIWLPTADPEVPELPPDVPRPWIWRVPRFPAELPVCESARAAILAARRAELLGQGEALDGHRLLLAEKVAAALDLMAGRPEVSEEGWALAGAVLAVSDRTRAVCQAVLATRKRESNMARGRDEGERAVVADDARHEAVVRRVSGAIARTLADNDWRNRADLRKSLASRDREHFDEAIARLIAAGQVAVDDDGPGTRFRHV